MDLGSLSQYGVAAIFILATFKLYKDMREDSSRREEKLMVHLDKVSDTLENINERLCNVESCVKKENLP